jgi:hypothetical protein
MLFEEIYIIAFCIAIIVGFWWFFSEKPNYNRVTRKIWTYWDNSNKSGSGIPKLVEKCIDGWKQFNPGYEIILLTKKNYMGYVTIPETLLAHPNFNDISVSSSLNPTRDRSDSSTRFEDLVRIWTLCEHGGVWIDATFFLKSRMDEWLFPNLAEFSGFYMDRYTSNPEWPVIENCFFACNKGSEFVRRWRDEFSEIGRFPNVEAYLESRKKMGVDFQRIVDPNYLAMHVAAQKVIQLDKYPVDRLVLQKAEDGPFRYLMEAGWNSEKAVRWACINKFPIMKFRGEERAVLEKGLHDEFSVEKCGWI